MNARILLSFLAVLIPPAAGRAEPVEFVAYSMQEAARRLNTQTRPCEEVAQFGGMTRVLGLVHDEQQHDWIVVGLADRSRPPLKLDDLVTAMRAVLVRGKYPLISIEKTAETDATGMQKIRVEGGIEDTALAREMIDVDVCLKKLALGELLAEVWGVRSYRSMMAEQGRRGTAKNRVISRFWVTNRHASLVGRKEDGVFAIMRLHAGIDTEVLYAEVDGKPVKELDTIRDEVGIAFASHVTAALEDLTVQYPVFERVEPILELVTLADGMNRLEAKADLRFFLEAYKTTPAPTPRQYKLRHVSEEIEEHDLELVLNGGIDTKPRQLKLKRGYPSAFRSVVLESRPSPTSLTWRPPLQGWPLPMSVDVQPATSARQTFTPRAPAFALDSAFVKRDESATGFDRSSPTAESQPPKKLSLLVVDFSGWRSQGLPNRVIQAVDKLRPDATVVSIGIKEGLPTDRHNDYDIVVSASQPDLQALRQTIEQKVVEARASSGQVVIHFDINEEGLPQQIRALLLQLPGKDETRGPGLLAGALLRYCGPDYAGTVVLRGHSDGTYCEGHVLKSLQGSGIHPQVVILESPRESWATWKGRFEQSPETLFITITADGDAPRKYVVDFGFGRAEEVKSKNYININVEKWDKRRVGPHSVPTAYGEQVAKLQVRGWLDGKSVDIGIEDVVLGDLVEAAGSKPRNLGELARSLVNSEDGYVIHITGFRQTGRDKARSIADAGLVAVWTPNSDGNSASSGKGAQLKIFERGDSEPSGNRGFVSGADPRTVSDPASTNVSFVFARGHELECPTIGDMPVKIAQGLAPTESGVGDPKSASVWSTTSDSPGPDTAIMTNMARQRLAGTPDQQIVLVVGTDKKADEMAASLNAQGVYVVRVRQELTHADAADLGSAIGSPAVLRVGSQPAIGVNLDGDGSNSPAQTTMQHGGPQRSGTQRSGGDLWTNVNSQGEKKDSVFVLNGKNLTPSQIVSEVEKKAAELGLATGPGNGTKVVVGGDPKDPEYQATVKALREKGYVVIEEHWEEGTLSEDEKTRRVAERCRKEKAKLGVTTGRSRPTERREAASSEGGGSGGGGDGSNGGTDGSGGGTSGGDGSGGGSGGGSGSGGGGPGGGSGSGGGGSSGAGGDNSSGRVGNGSGGGSRRVVSSPSNHGPFRRKFPRFPNVYVPPLRSTPPETSFQYRYPLPQDSDHIGGVMLDGVADVDDDAETDNDLVSGNFSLVVDGATTRVDPLTYRKFITALWCVYYSQQDPGISIDPISPGVEKHLVRYIGRVINTDLGRVMREADYTMKKWAVGTERPDIPGFQDVDDLTAAHGYRYFGASRRFWFVPEQMRFRRGGDLLLFDTGHMRLKTEYIFLNKASRAEPADRAFAEFFTNNYQDIARKYPVFKELFEYAKLVAVAKYLKEKGVPLHWFLLANKDLVLTEDSPGTVDELAKGSDHFKGVTIMGGVNLGVEGNYVFDAEAVTAIHRALSQVPQHARPSTSLSGVQDKSRLRSPTLSFQLDQQSYSVVPQHTLTSGKDRRGIRYQTDLAFRQKRDPGLELVRYFNPRKRDVGEFGRGWHLLIPYRVRPADQAMRRFLNAVISERMVVENLLSGRQETLTFSDDRYTIAGYVPDTLKDSQIVGLFLMSDHSYRLADKLGNQYHFDPEGYLTDMYLSPDPRQHMHVEYTRDATTALVDVPYRIEAGGRGQVRCRNTILPEKLAVTDCLNHSSETLVFSDGPTMATYLPARKDSSRHRSLTLLPDGSLQLTDRQGNQIRFGPDGQFASARLARDGRLVQSVSMGSQEVRFRYTLEPGGRFVIARAALTQEADSLVRTHLVRYEYDDEGMLHRTESSHESRKKRRPVLPAEETLVLAL